MTNKKTFTCSYYELIKKNKHTRKAIYQTAIVFWLYMFTVVTTIKYTIWKHEWGDRWKTKTWWCDNIPNEQLCY